LSNLIAGMFEMLSIAYLAREKDNSRKINSFVLEVSKDMEGASLYQTGPRAITIAVQTNKHTRSHTYKKPYIQEAIHTRSHTFPFTLTNSYGGGSGSCHPYGLGFKTPGNSGVRAN
jgi:hypothetical protein